MQPQGKQMTAPPIPFCITSVVEGPLVLRKGPLCRWLPMKKITEGWQVILPCMPCNDCSKLFSCERTMLG